MVKTVRDVNLKGMAVIMRVDFNVPMKDGKIQDDARIMAALPTIKYVMGENPKSLTLMSHLGDPEKDAKKAEEKAKKQGLVFNHEAYIASKHKMEVVAKYLSEKLGLAIVFISDINSQIQLVQNCKEGSIFMLENTRFDKRETSKNEEDREALAKEFARFGTIFVNDAFGTAHRAHASTSTIAKFVEHSVAGLLMEKEICNLEPLLKNPNKPFTAVIGGAKVSSKISVLQSLVERVDTLVIGGGMAYTFLKAEKHAIGNSIVENDYLDVATRLLDEAKKKGVRLLLPLDHICAKSFSESASPIVVQNIDIPDALQAMDVGEKTIKEYKKVIEDSKTILWNGPLGVFEFASFAKGTEEVAKAVAKATKSGATSIVGGGDSVAALNKFNLAGEMSHVSTGGGASLEYLEGKTLPGIACLEQL